ncbi:MAG: outer membrane beta-barrel protein [Ignavibacteria bacterium]|nr:outer membrane beta-barrel protein [Ignavibacteria bacterium]
MKSFKILVAIVAIAVVGATGCTHNQKVVRIPIQVIESDHTDKVFLSEPMDENATKALITENKSNKEGVPDTLLSKRTLTVNVKKQEPEKVRLCDTCIETNRYWLQPVVSEPYVSSRDIVRGKVDSTKSDTVFSKGSWEPPVTITGKPIPLPPKFGEKDTTKNDTVNTKIPLPSDWMFGVKGGINLSKMYVDPDAECLDCGVEQAGWLSGDGFAPLFSLFAKWKVNDGFTFMPELMYNKYIFSLPAIDYELRLHYLTFRPNFVFNIMPLDDAKTWNLYGHVAPSFGALINNSSVKSGGSELATWTGDIHKFDFGANLGVGVTKMFGDAFELGFDVSYTRSFTDNNRRTDKSNNFYRFNQGFELALTFAIPLPKSAPESKITIETIRIDTVTITQIDTVRERVRDTVNINFYNGVRVDEITINTSTDITKTLVIDSTCYVCDSICVIHDTCYVRIDTCYTGGGDCIDITELLNFTAEYVCSNNFNLCMTDNYFDLDKYKLEHTGEMEDGNGNLEHQMSILADFLNMHDNIYVQIYGHTDSAGVPPYCRPDAEHPEWIGSQKQAIRDNQDLSNRRAKQAADILRDKLKDKSKIGVVKGVGSAYPAYTACYDGRLHNLSAAEIKEQEMRKKDGKLQPGENYKNRWVEIRFVCKKTIDDSLYMYEGYPTENDYVADCKLVAKTAQRLKNPKPMPKYEQDAKVPFKAAKSNAGRKRGKVNPKEYKDGKEVKK